MLFEGGGSKKREVFKNGIRKTILEGEIIRNAVVAQLVPAADRPLASRQAGPPPPPPNRPGGGGGKVQKNFFFFFFIFFFLKI